MSKITKIINIYGMHCKSCENAIEEEVKQLEGVFSVKASYNKSNLTIVYDNEFCDESQIKRQVKKAGYSTKETSITNFLGLGIIVILMLFLGSNSLIGYDTSSLIQNASLFMIFVAGVLSSFHCIGMCGGIMLTQTLDKDSLLTSKKASFNVALKYNLGRVISYTLLGGIIGAFGSIFSLSIKMQGMIQLIAAFFMIITGLSMSGIKLFKNINIIIPIKKSSCEKNSKNPFIVGILNGFMPCGPLQTMQLYALGTGSFIMGAMSMLAFSIGTVPLMLGFGYISSRLSKKLSNNIFKYSAVFIIILGISMAQRGFALTGSSIFNINNSSKAAEKLAPVVDGYQEVVITATRSGYEPSANFIKGDIPVKLTIKGEELTSCNNSMYFPQYDQYIDLSKGDVVAQIEPNNKDISFTCWMGMIRGKISVLK